MLLLLVDVGHSLALFLHFCSSSRVAEHDRRGGGRAARCAFKRDAWVYARDHPLPAPRRRIFLSGLSYDSFLTPYIMNEVALVKFHI